MREGSEVSPAPVGAAGAALPSPGRARYLLLLVVLLMTGSLAGDMVYSQVFGTAFEAQWRRCTMDAAIRYRGVDFDDPPRHVLQEVQNCVLPELVDRALVIVAGSVLVVVLGVALMLLLPGRLVRRAGPLTPAPPPWQELAEVAATEMAVAPGTAVFFGSYRLREAFTVRGARGARGSRIILPPGIANLPKEQANAVLRHEVAHVAAGDVTLVWLTRGVWAAVSVVLLIPVAVALFQGRWRADLGMTETDFLGWPEYAVRSMALFVLAGLMSLALLRLREHEADLRAARGPAGAALGRLLRQQPATQPSRWRRAVAIHPPPERRADALLRPHIVTHTPTADFTTVLLAITVTSAVSASVGYLIRFTVFSLYSIALVTLVQGVLVGLAWGVPVWRNVAMAYADRRALPVRGPVVGVYFGSLLGLVAQGGNHDLSYYLTASFAAAGAGAVSVALAGVWVRGRPSSVSPRRDWVTAASLNALLLGGAYWFGVSLSAAVVDHGWSGGFWTIGLVLPAPAILWTLPIAVAAMWWMVRAGLPYLRPTRFPAQSAGPPERAWLPASVLLSVSLAAAATVLVPLWILGDAGGDTDLLAHLDLAAGVVAGVGCLIALISVAGQTGLGAAIAAAPATTILVTTMAWWRRAPSWLDAIPLQIMVGRVSLNFVAFVMVLIGLPAALLPDWRLRRRRIHPRTAVLVAVAATLMVAVSVVVLFPLPSTDAGN